MNMNSLRRALHTALVATGIVVSNWVSAENYNLPVTPVNPNQTQANNDDVSELVNQVVSQLPKTRQDQLGYIKPLENKQTQAPAQNYTGNIDSYGRSQSTNVNPNQAQVQTERTAFDRMKTQMRKKFKPIQTVELNEGGNATIPAAKFIMNSVRTNFKEVDIRTSDPDVTVNVEGSFIYFVTENDAPFNLLVFEKGIPESQVNMTIWPLNVLATMIELNVKLSNKTKNMLNQKYARIRVDKREQEKRIRDKESELMLSTDPEMLTNPYEQNIHNLFAQVAGNMTPKGFDFVKNIPDENRYPCRFEAKSEAKQRLVSSRRIIDIVLVTNVHHGKKVTLREEQCWIDDDVIATGILNRATLEPGQKTEVYVMRDRLYFERIRQRRDRPSLIN